MPHEFRVRIVIERDGDGFYAFCPGLPEVHTCGATIEEAAQNVRNAATAVLRTKLRLGQQVVENDDLVRTERAPTQRYEDQIRIPVFA